MHLELIILEGTQAGRHIPLVQTPVTFGRSSAAGVSFPLDNFMSGMHVTVQHALNGVILIDLRSSNGTFLNGERITQAMAVPGDVIKIGTLAMTLVAQKTSFAETAPPPDLPSAELTAATNLMPAFLAPGPEPVADAPLEPFAEPVAVSEQPVLELLRHLQEPLFCLLDPAADGAIPDLLEGSLEQHERLYKGNGVGAAAEVSAPSVPYLIHMGPDSALLKALVKDGWGRGWASFFTSTASFEELSEHFGKFYRVQIEAGEVYFRFFKPEVLRDFLKDASKVELGVFFGPVGEWLVETEGGEGVLRAKNGIDGVDDRGGANWKMREAKRLWVSL